MTTDQQYKKMLEEVRDGTAKYYRRTVIDGTPVSVRSIKGELSQVADEYLCRCGRWVKMFAEYTHKKYCTWVVGTEMFLGSESVPPLEEGWWHK